MRDRPIVMTLSAFLTDAGFRQVRLSRSGVGHFHAAGSLNGRPVAVLIDTGAASTVVSLALAREYGLSMEKLNMTGGGAGGANLETYQHRRCHALARGSAAAAPCATGDGPHAREPGSGAEGRSCS